MSSASLPSFLALEYIETSAPADSSVPFHLRSATGEPAPETPLDPPGISEADLAAHVDTACATLTKTIEARHKAELETLLRSERDRINTALQNFTADRQSYFSRIEGEVVQLALAVARKILHREALADPMLLTAVVRIALDQMQGGTEVSIRLPSGDVPAWTQHLSTTPSNTSPRLVADPSLAPGDCIVETCLGTANFSIEAQLKEVEQGFFDLLAHHPDRK